MSETLKPCPFCLSLNLLDLQVADDPHSRWQVVCEDCSAQGPDADTKEKAAELWNRRPSGWISVKERLPEKFCGVLVYLDEIAPCTFVTCGFYVGRGVWKMPGGATVGKGVTHWMPLPSAPEVEE